MHYPKLAIIQRALLVVPLLLLAAPAAANRCTEPVRVGPRPADLLPPLASFADDLLQADLSAARNIQNPIAAIARLQQNEFDMHHPQAAPNNPAAYFRMRCAPRERYTAVQDAIRRRVDELAPGYRQQRQFLGSANPRIRSDNPDQASPGLLNLLLLSNQYDTFTGEAQSFLRSAIGDSEAARHFSAVAAIAQNRLDYLGRWEEAYASEYATGSLGLLPAEVAGLTALKNFQSHIDPLRAEHVAHWLQQEAASYQKLLNEQHDPANLMQLSFALRTAISQLELAQKIALPDQRPAIDQLAVERGDALMQLERFQAAVQYYDVADAQPQRQQAQARLDAIGQQRVARVREQAERDILNMRKSADETRAFEEETDALAEELGVDLDDF